MYMKAYLEKLKAYVEIHPIQFDDDCDFPALDSLYWHYSECHNMSNGKTKQASANLNACLEELSLKDNDRVFSLWELSARNTSVSLSWQDSSLVHS